MMIGQYSIYEWIVLFYIYSFFGWIFESTYVSIKKKKPVNRGFLKGPFLPIYGGGAVMMLFVSEPFKEYLFLTFCAGVVGATLLELVTGILMERIFKIRYWDYSSKRWNYRGYICVSSSILWGFFTIGMNEIVQPEMEKVLKNISATPMQIGVGIITILLVWDVITSVKEAIDLREMLETMEEMWQETQKLRKRADVLIACFDEDWKEFLENHPMKDKAEEIYKGVEFRYNKIKQSIKEIDFLSEAQKEELGELKEKFGILIHRLEVYRKMRKRKGRQIGKRIQGNPSMTSSRYRMAFEALKEKIREQHQE